MAHGFIRYHKDLLSERGREYFQKPPPECISTYTYAHMYVMV